MKEPIILEFYNAMGEFDVYLLKIHTHLLFIKFLPDMSTLKVR